MSEFIDKFVYRMFLATILLGSMLASAGHAAVIASYDFSAGTTTNSTSTTGASATSTDSEVDTVASSFTAGPGFVGSDSSGNAFTGISTSSGNAAPSVFVRSTGTNGSTDVDGGNQANTVAAADFFQFTVTPNADALLSLSTLTFDTAQSISTNFGGAYFVRSDAGGDNFATTIGTGFGQTSNSFVARSVNLSEARFQNLTAPLTFRVYVYDNGTASNTTGNVNRLDNVVLNGTTAVPEPAALGVLALASLGLGRRRRA